MNHIPESQFDRMRMLGALAMRFSHDWLKNPTEVAMKFTDFYLGDSTFLDRMPTGVMNTLYTNSLLCGLWAASGYPTVTLGHRTAAMFCATRMRPEDATEFLRSPWPAFAIRLPTDLLMIEQDGALYPGSLLMVGSLPATQVPLQEIELRSSPDTERWWFKLLADTPDDRMFSQKLVEQSGMSLDQVTGFFDGICLWGFNLGSRHLAAPNPAELDADGLYNQWNTLESTKVDERSDRLARSLIIGACLYLSGSPEERAERSKSDEVKVTVRKSKRREGDELPQYTEYQVASSIKINLHHAVRDYVRHGGSAPTVQTMVAGHWKRVPHGPKGALRKLCHIRPYWRGDVDAPISARMK